MVKDTFVNFWWLLVLTSDVRIKRKKSQDITYTTDFIYSSYLARMYRKKLTYSRQIIRISLSFYQFFKLMKNCGVVFENGHNCQNSVPILFESKSNIIFLFLINNLDLEQGQKIGRRLLYCNRGNTSLTKKCLWGRFLVWLYGNIRIDILESLKLCSNVLILRFFSSLNILDLDL